MRLLPLGVFLVACPSSPYDSDPDWLMAELTGARQETFCTDLAGVTRDVTCEVAYYGFEQWTTQDCKDAFAGLAWAADCPITAGEYLDCWDAAFGQSDEAWCAAEGEGMFEAVEPCEQVAEELDTCFE